MAQHGLSGAPGSVASPISPLPGGVGLSHFSNHHVPTSGGPQPSSTPTTAGNSGQPQHKRVYQACIPCRRRKVRCDLGSVDNPNDPPCVRCRRESKECYFSATRRKRKAYDEDTNESLYDDAGTDEYIVRNGRKRLTVESSPPPKVDRRRFSDVPLTPGGTRGRTQPLRRPNDGPSHHSSTGSIDGFRRSTSEFGNGEPNQPLENLEAKEVMRQGMYGPHDALDLLYKAATTDSAPPVKQEDLRRYQPSRQDSFGHRPSQARDMGHESQQSFGRGASVGRQPIDPALSDGRNETNPSDDPGYAEALKIWGRFRFVRAGWFTAAEAIDYIDYYYRYLSPLTPISPPTFRSPATHITLLTEEPILTVTLLTIASRYRQMPGPGGHCRSHAIHEQLWTYLRSMVERVVWGQEAFGGGFCGSGAESLAQSSNTAPWRGLRRGSLRTLGTIESLMILTEWHPRALHFPPNEVIDELLLPSYDMRDSIADAEGPQRPPIGGKRIESWLEPAWRSDRMCWMLLSTGWGLAYELGVFDEIEEMLATGTITRPEYEEEAYRLRAGRIKRLLLIYLSQLAGRLAWTNMVPDNMRTTPIMNMKNLRVHTETTTPGTNPSSMSTTFNHIPDLELDDQVIYCWAGISHAMQVGNDKLFRSRKYTTELIQSGNYVTELKNIQPILQKWKMEFERYRLPPYIKHILNIEYEYVRIYVNSLALQAVVDRCTNNAGGGTAPGGSVSGHSGPQLSPQTQHYYGKLPLGQLGGFGPQDQEYVKEVVAGSRNLLRTVVDYLLPGDYLKHAPVRTYFRIISGAMFLLKTFALGAPKSDVEMSIALMDRTVDALRNCIVDDVHLGIRFADLLESLTSRLRNRFIHAPAPTTSAGDGRSSTPGQAEPTAMGNNGMPSHHQQSNGLDPAWAKLPERANTPANISATPFDVTSGNFPFPTGSASMFGPSTPAAADPINGNGLSAPGSAAHNNNNQEGIYDAAWNNPENEFWYLAPGPAFYQNLDNSSVNMTAEGIHVGGLDLLEYMAMDPDPQAFAFLDSHGV